MKTAAGTMKTAVLYFSQTGNTAKVGAAIAEAIEADLVAPIQEVTALESFDLVFVGMPVIRFGAPEQVRAFLAEQCDGRRVALFVTHAAPVGLPELEPWLDDCRAAAGPYGLVGFFNCQGQLAEPVKQYMASSGTPELEQFAAMSGCADGQPDEAAVERAGRFAREIVARVTSELTGGPTDETQRLAV